LININKLRKKEILWLYNKRCMAHGCRYIEHPACFERERYDLPDCPIEAEKVGFLDIEEENGKIYEDLITPKDIRSFVFDKYVLLKLCQDIRRFDRVVVHWGKDRRHDLPFLRTRALKWNREFPLYREIFVTDTYDMAKAKLSLHSYRLESICQFFNIPAKGHRLDPDLWQRAKAGCQKSLKHILEHCREDVIAMELVYKKLVPFFRGNKVSI